MKHSPARSRQRRHHVMTNGATQSARRVPSPAGAAAPQRPRLKPYITVVPVREDYLLIHGPNLFLRISDEGVPLIQRVLPLLDGHHSIPDLLREVPQADEEELLSVLATLSAQGIVEDAALEAPLNLPPTARAYLDAQMRIFSHFTYNATLAQSRLLRADILVIGCGPIGAAAAQALQAAGVGRLGLLDSRGGQPWDAYASPLHRPNGTRSRALARVLPRRAANTRIESVESRTTDFRRFTLDELEHAVEGRSHVLAALESPDSTLLAAVNEACARRDVSWTAAELYGPVAHVGPTVLPKRTACWRCYDLRRKGAQPGLDRFLMYERHRESQPDEGENRAGLLPTFGPVVGGIAAQEAIASISRFTQPALINRILVFDLVQWTSQRHRVLRLPKCPACSAAEVPDLDRFDVEPVYL